MAAVGVVFIMGATVALIWAFGWPLRKASTLLDQLVDGDGPPCFDDPADFDAQLVGAAAADEAWERLAGTEELFELATSVGVVYDPKAVVAEAERILAGEGR